MKKKDLIFVDLDGTILDYKLRAFKTFSEVIGEFRREDLSFDAYIQQRKNGVSNYELYSSLSTRIINKETFHSEWLELIEDSFFLKYDELFSDTPNWIKHHSDSAHLVLCTARRIKKNLIAQLEYLNIQDAFQKILVSEGRFTKHELLSLYLTETQQSNRDFYFLGDTLSDMVTGRSAGGKVFFVERGFTSYSSLAGVHVDSHTKYLPRIPH